jgi:hypothetical protein
MATKRLAVSGAVALLGFLAVSGSQDRLSKKFTARDVETYLRSLGPWVDEAKTCDSFKAGDPDRGVKAMAVSWMSTMRALQEAQARGCDLFITHETTFYSHYDNDPSFDSDRSTVEKKDFSRKPVWSFTGVTTCGPGLRMLPSSQRSLTGGMSGWNIFRRAVPFVSFYSISMVFSSGPCTPNFLIRFLRVFLAAVIKTPTLPGEIL